MKSKIFRFIGVVSTILVVSVSFLAVLLSTMSVVQAAPCTDNVLRVKKDASGAADGCSWDDAFPDLQLALSAAESGDQIWVASGVYTPGLMVTDTFEMPSAVKMYGGFVGSENELNQRDWSANPTVLSGDIDGDDIVDENGVVLTTTNIIGDNSYHVVLFDGTSTPVTETTSLDGFIVTAGYAHGASGSDIRGGGIFCNGNGIGSDCSPALVNITFSGNKSSNLGGAMYNDGANYGNSSPSLAHVVFTQNYAHFDGGALYNAGHDYGSSSPNLTDVTFLENQAFFDGGVVYNTGRNEGISSPSFISVTLDSNEAGERGGGMVNEGINNGNSSPVLTDVIFVNNNAGDSGGGIYNWAYTGVSNPKLMTVTFRSNVAGGGKTAGNGGGMVNQDGNPILNNVLFENNVAEYGGGMSNGGGSPILTDVTFISNTATIDGGGMANDDYSYPQLYNVKFIRNSAKYHGGGMFNYFFADPIMEQVVFLENVATDGLGGGLSNYTGSDPIITDVVFIGNIADWGGGLYSYDNHLQLENATFLGNTAVFYGGAIGNYDNEITMTNVIFSGNYAEKYGGGAYNSNSVVEMNNVTLSGNAAGWSGGGMFSYYESDVSVNNSIFWHNQDSSGIGTITATLTISENSVVTLTNSLVQSSGGSSNWLAAPYVDGGGNIDSDPLFIKPIDLTTVPTTTGNLRLLFGSPAIDAGDNDLVPVGITEDLDGKPRIIDGIVDMGAYEALWLENYLPLIMR